jgi:5'-nucleotidase
MPRPRRGGREPRRSEATVGRGKAKLFPLRVDFFMPHGIKGPSSFIGENALNMTRILVSNDDGINSEGLHKLVEALRCLGEVVAVAPDREQSASSHSLTMHRPLRLREAGSGLYEVDGTPTDCILLGVNCVFKGRPPDLVVSGINKGGNLGDDIAYSGTVSAAMEGARLGIASFAISLFSRADFRFQVAADFAVRLSRWIIKKPIRDPILLNVNVPNIIKEEIRGVRITRQGRCIYNGVVVEKTDPRGEKYYWIGGEEPGFHPTQDSDIEAVKGGWVSVTPLKMDLTDVEAMAHLKDLGSWQGRGN